jgi:thiamine pyrophosphokinase
MKKTAYLFFAGKIKNYNDIKEIIGTNENIYGADGGGLHIHNLKLKPKLLLGDFDSLSAEIYEKFSKECQIKRYPPNKNYSDGELLIKTLYNDYDELIIFGALGGRYDHSFFNAFLLEIYPKCKIINNKEELFVIDSNHKFISEIGKTVSFLPLDRENCISLINFEYELNKKEVKRGESLTLSNIVLKNDAEAIVHRGAFLVIKER